MDQRLFFLDALRGVAAINVMLMHVAAHFGYRFMGAAYFSVDLFFILSGFVIAARYTALLASGMRWVEFVKQRLIRLYPMYFLGIFVGAFGLNYISQNNLSTITPTESLNSILLNLFYIPFFNAADYPVFGTEVERGLIFPVNGPAWSLFFEIVINIGFLLTSRWSIRRHIALAATCLFVLSYLTFSPYGATGWATHNFGVGFIRVIAGFHAGIVIAHLYRHERVESALNMLRARSKSMAMLLLLGLCFVSSGMLPYPRAVYLLAVIGSPLVILIGAHLYVPSRWQPTCYWLGLVSYPLYCLHMPIIRAAKAVVGYDQTISHSLFFACIVVAITAVVSIAAARFFDEPSRRLLRRLFASKNLARILQPECRGAVPRLVVFWLRQPHLSNVDANRGKILNKATAHSAPFPKNNWLA
ncbi:acyltransferase [Aliirhizobium terrae]|uniref:acyltransferase family protein n=1 Tax=Terrirhizobium terrae TaxID=2926709 RepID=UPI002574C632|nr:acyltransferase [Rhizobium sp. CC-CFT758]WJH39676.1 acyltransferase [Rhizobium sp. CC-CFT758]